ncbi:MAG TPA: creatininase family protein [Casimicrobiaceae bacterium]
MTTAAPTFRVLAAVLWLLAVVPAARAASASPEVLLESLTSPELAARVAAGSTTILVPIGGTEQNGPYMTLGKHNARVVELATRIAQRLGNALVAPVIAYVPEGNIAPPTQHMRYPGTISVPTAAFEATLESAAKSFRAAGFRDVVFLGDHGGYQASLARVAARLDKEWAATPARAHAMPDYYRASSSAWSKALAARGYSAAEIGVHAGLADTSLSMAATPGVVRADALHRAQHPSTARGVEGDPARASAALGAAGVDAIVASTVTAIQHAVARR